MARPEGHGVFPPRIPAAASSPCDANILQHELTMSSAVVGCLFAL